MHWISGFNCAQSIANRKDCNFYHTIDFNGLEIGHLNHVNQPNQPLIYHYYFRPGVILFYACIWSLFYEICLSVFLPWNIYCKLASLISVIVAYIIKLNMNHLHYGIYIYVGLLSIKWFGCLFVSKKMPNNAVIPWNSTVLIVLVV